jgi:hypothetical protein
MKNRCKDAYYYSKRCTIAEESLKIFCGMKIFEAESGAKQQKR